MDRSDIKYNAYIDILKEELVPAMGCTEPIAIAYAAALARDVLGTLPDAVDIGVSGSIIKNVKSVIVPNTGGMKGIRAAAAAGIVAGAAEKKLEVISEVSAAQLEAIKAFMAAVPIEISHIDTGNVFEIDVRLTAGGDSSRVRILGDHTNVVLTERSGEVLMEKNCDTAASGAETDRSLLCMEDIWDFANTVEISDVSEVIERQIACNTAIAEEGIRGDYGANIGSVLLAVGGDIRARAKAMAAAGSDARMSGCNMPVIINSGSGNQGITCSVPVIEYAKELGSGREKLIRALVLSNLTSIHVKTGIGTLSAYCGAVTAGAGAGVGIAYLLGGGYDDITHTLVNALAIVSGIICDGAKPSCAAKIAAAVDAGIFGYDMYRSGQQFYAGDGIVGRGVEQNIVNVGTLGRDGMRGTNDEIIDIMINC